MRYNLQSENFTATKEQLLQIPTNALSPIPKFLFVGLGERKNLSVRLLQETGGFLASHLSSISKIALDATSLESAAQLLPFGFLLKEWQFGKYKRAAKTPPRSLQCLCQDPTEAARSFLEWKALYQGICTARELTSEPANCLFPKLLPNAACS